jgi:hypothetical protein
MEYSRSDIDPIARKHGWTFVTFQVNIGMLSYKKGDVRINIYTTKMTVATCLNHPKKGKTQMFRKKVTLTELQDIFKNPRVHTNKGYRTK